MSACLKMMFARVHIHTRACSPIFKCCLVKCVCREEARMEMQRLKERVKEQRRAQRAQERMTRAQAEEKERQERKALVGFECC